MTFCFIKRAFWGLTRQERRFLLIFYLCENSVDVSHEGPDQQKQAVRLLAVDNTSTVS